jgi:polyribonucleotide 5'-hydroxyl-kinase
MTKVTPRSVTCFLFVLARTSGMIVNTCGWVDSTGYELIKYTIDTISADLVLVLDNEKIYSDLNKEYSSKNIRVVKLGKSGGVCKKICMLG